MVNNSSYIEFGIDVRIDDNNCKKMIGDIDYVLKQFLDVIREQDEINYLYIQREGVIRNHLITLTYILIQRISQMENGFILKNFDNYCDEIITLYFGFISTDYLTIMDEYLYVLRCHIESIIVVQKIEKRPSLILSAETLSIHHLAWLVKKLKELNLSGKPTTECLLYLYFYDVKINYQEEKSYNVIQQRPQTIGLEVTIGCIEKGIPNIEFIYLNLKYLFFNYPEQRKKYKKRVYNFLKKQPKDLPMHIKMPDDMYVLSEIKRDRENSLITQYDLFRREIDIIESHLSNHKTNIITTKIFSEYEQKYLMKNITTKKMDVGQYIKNPEVLLKHVGDIKYKNVFFDLSNIYEMVTAQDQGVSDIPEMYYKYIASYKSEVKHYRKTVYTYLGVLSEDSNIVDFLIKRQMTNMIFRIDEIKKFSESFEKKQENLKKDCFLNGDYV